MPAPRLSPKIAEKSLAAIAEHGSISAAARALGIPRPTLQARVRAAGYTTEHRQDYSLDVPMDEIDVPSLVAERKAKYARKAAAEEAAFLQNLRIKIPGPIGIVHFGDPHVDDDGTDLEMLERHCQIVRETEGLFAVNLGDTTNNWCGRLARLYAEQSTSAAEAWKLAEWFLELLGEKCLYLVGGNHDLWSGAGDPLKWIARRSGAGLYAPSQVRINLQFPAGRDIRINCRHDFKGHSMYNPAHGAAKALLMGVRDHIAICGHKHTSGYNTLKDPATGIIGHAVQVASYKIHDRYQKEAGFKDQHISPCAVTILDPEAEDEADVVQHFWRPERAAFYLTCLRERYKTQQKNGRKLSTAKK